MDQKAILKAESRLRICQKAIADLAVCDNYVAFTDIWYTFLTAAKSIYTTLEQGAKVSAQSRQWFGGKANDRRKDPLLQYIYQARNDDEHGLEPITKFVPGHMAFGVNKPGYSSHVIINSNEFGGFNIDSLDNKPILIERQIASAQLIPVRDRDGKILQVPDKHLGNSLNDQTPLNLANLIAHYLSLLVADAKRLS